MNNLKRLNRTMALVMAGAAVFAIAACSSSPEPTATQRPASPTATQAPAVVPTATTAAPTAAPTATAVATAAPATPTAASQPATPTAASQQPSTGGMPLTGRLAVGEEIFQTKAGGVGCAACHGKDGKGATAPANRGSSAEEIRVQLATNEAMQFISLTDDEIEAVAEYLAYLATQP